MSIGIKGVGITLSGIAALIVINKALNVSERAINTIAESRKWKHYYKYGDHAYATPPGYAMNKFTHPKTGEDIEVDSPEQQEEYRRRKERERRNANRTPIDINPIGVALEKIAKAVLKSKGIDIDSKKEEKDTEKDISEHSPIEVETTETETTEIEIDVNKLAEDVNGDELDVHDENKGDEA